MGGISRVILIFAAAVLPLLACNGGSGGDNGGGGGGGAEIELLRVFGNVSFDRPVDFENAGDGSGRAFVVEQKGVIRVVGPSGEAGTFLDIEDSVFFSGESGLLGVVFHPDYESNGFFYVYYVTDNPRRSVVSRWSASGDDSNRADPGSELVLLEVPQPQATNHKAGQLAFGPDGYLYIATGDGGASGSTSRDRTNLLGSILRIDVDNTDAGLNYGIPPDNPFAGNASGFREEIFAYGFRNPWRFAFDPANGTLFAGDVGDSAREEIDLVQSGLDYGWDVMEGTICHTPPSGCDRDGLELPIFDYGRDMGGTVIAGLFYRGGEIPELAGKFIYGDFVSGGIWALGWNGTQVTGNEEIGRLDSITTFGVDEDGEAYVCLLGGEIFRFVLEEGE